jgi:chromosome partitioning protein
MTTSTAMSAGLGWPGAEDTQPSDASLGWPTASTRAADVSRETTDEAHRATLVPPAASEPAAPWQHVGLGTDVPDVPAAASEVSRETRGPVSDAEAASQPSSAAVDPLEDQGGEVSRETPADVDGVRSGEMSSTSGNDGFDTGSEGAHRAHVGAEHSASSLPGMPLTDPPSTAEDRQPTAALGALASGASTIDRSPASVEVSRETPPPPGVPVPTRGGPEPWPRPPHPRVITVANQKGGVGKTTSTVNLAAALSMHGARVLVVDLDPQGNASTAFGIDHREGAPSVYDVLVDGRPIPEVAVRVSEFPNLHCVPATIDVAGAEVELVPVVARETRLRKALAGVGGEYDYIFVDCPPSLGLLTVNALVAAHEVLIPIQCEFYALEGLTQLLRNIELVRSALNEQLTVSTILLTMYDARTRLAEQVANDVRDHFGELVVDVVIPRSVRISEAPGFGQTVLTFDPASRGAKAYVEAARVIAWRGAGQAMSENVVTN